MNYTITIDNVDYTQYVSSGIPIKDGIANNELDGCTIDLLMDSETSFNKFSPCTITCETLSFNFILFGTQHIVAKTKHRYIIEMIEPTKLLENIIIPGVAFTTYPSIVNQHLDYQVTLACIKINLETGYSVIPSQALLSKIATYTTHDFVFDGLINAKELFETMLNIADIRPKINSITTGNGIVLDYEDPNSRGVEVTFSNLLNSAQSKEAEYDVNGLAMIAKNGIGQSFSNSVTTLFESLGNDEDTLSDTAKDYFRTNYPVYGVNRFYMKFRGPVGTLSTDLEVIYDITEFVAEKDAFNVMTVDEKKTAIVFERGKPNLTNLRKSYKSNALFGGTHTCEKWLLYTWGSENLWAESTMDMCEILGYKAIYYPQIDLFYDEVKDSTASEQRTFSRTICQQESNLVNIKLTGLSIKSKTKVIGNDELVKDVVVNNPTELFSLGDEYQGYVIDHREMSFKKDYICVRYHLTKDFALKNLVAELARPKRAYAIPASGYIERYIKVPLSSTTDNVKHVVMKSASITSQYGSDAFAYCEFAYYESETDDYYLIKLKDNHVVGYFKDVFDGVNINQGLNYCNNEGTESSFTFYFYGTDESFEADTTDRTKLPLIYGTYDQQGSSGIATKRVSNVMKDPFEQLTFVFVKRG